VKYTQGFTQKAGMITQTVGQLMKLVQRKCWQAIIQIVSSKTTIGKYYIQNIMLQFVSIKVLKT